MLSGWSTSWCSVLAPGNVKRNQSTRSSKSAITQFHIDSDHTTADDPRRAAVRKALGNSKVARGKTESAFTSWQHARDAASEIKYDGLNRLDGILTELEAKFTARGGNVFWASDAAQGESAS